MWIAVFDFFTGLLLVALFLYGLREWDRLFIAPEGNDLEASGAKSGDPPESRAPLWILIVGGGVLGILRWLWNSWML